MKLGAAQGEEQIQGKASWQPHDRRETILLRKPGACNDERRFAAVTSVCRGSPGRCRLTESSGFDHRTQEARSVRHGACQSRA